MTHLSPASEIITAALALLGLGLVCAVVATALVDLWRHTADARAAGVPLPFRRALIVAALIFDAAALAGVTVLILSAVAHVTDLDLIPRGTLAHDAARLNLAVRLAVDLLLEPIRRLLRWLA